MSTAAYLQRRQVRATSGRTVRTAGIILLVASIFVVMLAILWMGQPSMPGSHSIAGLFALDATQSWWYATRAAGLTSYMLLWLSTAWGLAIPSRTLAAGGRRHV